MRDQNTGKTVHLDVPEAQQKEPCLGDEEILKLAEHANLIEQHYGKAMDIEWAIDKDLSFPKNIFIVQARPETVWGGKPMETSSAKEDGRSADELKVVVKGLPAGKRGYGVGVAKIVLSPDDASKKMVKGEGLCPHMT